MATARLPHRIGYRGTQGSARWQGCVVEEPETFVSYLQSTVRERLEDAAERASLASVMQGLATTGMATEFVERVLGATPEPLDWEIGEALAECVLAEDEGREIHWPWNQARDRRTPRASLPGSDLVGFCRQGDQVLLLFGEVKTSSEGRTPPGVMNGRSGMAWQLGEAATRIDLQRTLLFWLASRCQQPDLFALYRAAVQTYIESLGRELLLVGVLLRDTLPDERDLKGRACDLAERVPAPTRVELFSWYLPVPIHEWPTLLGRGAP